jgi:hypothetical protein
VFDNAAQHSNRVQRDESRAAGSVFGPLLCLDHQRRTCGGEIADLDRNPSNQAGIGDHAEHWRSGLPERHKRIILTTTARSALAWRLGQRLVGSA